MSHFNTLAFPALVLPLSSSLGLPMADVLQLSFAMYLLFGLTALPWGMAADKWGAKPVLLIFFLGSGLSGLAAGMFAGSPLGLSLSLAGVGLFSGIYHPAGMGMISKGCERVSLALGYNGMFGNLGLAMAPLVTGLWTWVAGPRAALLFIGAANLAGLVAMSLLKLEEPQHCPEKGAAKGSGLVGAFVILLVCAMLAGIVYQGATVILPAFLEIRNVSLLQAINDLWPGLFSGNLVATVTTALTLMAGIIGQYVGGRVAEKKELRLSYLTFHLITVPLGLVIAAVANIPLVMAALAYLFFMLGMQPIENTLVARLTPARLHHSAYGLKFVGTFGLGSVAVWMVGGIERRWGIDAVFPSLALLTLILVATIGLLIMRTQPVFSKSRS